MASAATVASGSSNGALASNGGNASASHAPAAPTAAQQESIQEQIRQLDDARKLVLANVGHYPMIVQGILPILNPSSLPQLRRWGADFLAEAFAAPSMPSREKESLSLLVLESLKGMLENANEDPFVLRSIIQAASSIYPLIMRWIINNSYDSATWERIGVIKSRILRLWELPSPSLKICCIKFAQRVVLAQTLSPNSDHRRDGLDISLKLIPQNHPLLDPRHLEAEATGLLDRMLSVLQDNSDDAIVVDATLNTLSILVRTRPATVNRIITAILNFDPLRLAAAGNLTPRTRVMVKSMEKTTRMLLIHLTKRDPHSSYNQRMQQQIERLMRSKAELLDDAGRKRQQAEQQAGDAKRQKLASGSGSAQAQAQPQQQQQHMSLPQRPLIIDIPPLGPPPHSLADIFALTTSPQLRSFNASHVPLELVAKISVSTLARLEPQFLQRAITGIRDRLASLDAAAATSAINPNTVPLDVEPNANDEDDDDYEPDFTAAEDAEQIMNKLDSEGTMTSDIAAAVARVDASSLGLGAFKLPTAPTLSTEQVVKVGQATVLRVFGMMQVSEEASAPAAAAPAPSTAVGARKTGKAGLNRVAATTYDKDAWITILTRLATRSVSGLEGDEGDDEDDEEDEDDEMEEGEEADDKKKLVKREPGSGSGPGSRPELNDKIRELLFRYVLEDFRKRIDIAIYWLCEEWYNSALSGSGGRGRTTSYDIWAVKVLDGFVPYLHAQDKKVLTRFVSGIPALNKELMQRVKGLCRDPSMVLVALTALLYQLKMRPPARELALDTMQDIYLEFDDARTVTAKYLASYRPEFVAAQTAAAEKEAAEKEAAEKEAAEKEAAEAAEKAAEIAAAPGQPSTETDSSETSADNAEAANESTPAEGP
ncbi:mrna cleavage and polyadenylation specificity factor complex subunit [Ophiostoma piceae UAMH 11346]|uniref:Mrna cleavage and polyadenylation specificity factor complex subunit n=1 Tax=Ophiostoma piceae (strain UAMH 11346) TaxID=1262450 RepID=S3CBE8_OPHP1|nr:mrna cleavage and polyadenylation specificity factor complex subunit [Ophiostoma piceae UAMH 11346]